MRSGAGNRPAESQLQDTKKGGKDERRGRAGGPGSRASALVLLSLALFFTFSSSTTLLLSLLAPAATQADPHPRPGPLLQRHQRGPQAGRLRPTRRRARRAGLLQAGHQARGGAGQAPAPRAPRAHPPPVRGEDDRPGDQQPRRGGEEGVLLHGAGLREHVPEGHEPHGASRPDRWLARFVAPFLACPFGPGRLSPLRSRSPCLSPWFPLSHPARLPARALPFPRRAVSPLTFSSPGTSRPDPRRRQRTHAFEQVPFGDVVVDHTSGAVRIHERDPSSSYQADRGAVRGGPCRECRRGELARIGFPSLRPSLGLESSPSPALRVCLSARPFPLSGRVHRVPLHRLPPAAPAARRGSKCLAGPRRRRRRRSRWR